MDDSLVNEIQQEASDLSAEVKTAEAPQLIFGSVPEQAASLPAAQSTDTAVIDDSMLTDAEKKQVLDFSKQINLADTNSILQYGAGTQKKMADFSDAALVKQDTTGNRNCSVSL